MGRRYVTIDGNEAAAYVAYKTSEVIAVYPITPSSPMGELSDAWAAAGEPNLWGQVPLIQQMQSEGGAAGAIHGALQTGALTTTFTASQGLLLMIPNMYKIAGELTSTVFHISARSLATHGLSIFGDHSDVMAARTTGWAMLFAASVQEVMDFALIAQASTLRARVPFLHVFDGFRTSHEIMKIEALGEEDLRAMIDMDLVAAHRQRALSPERPVIRGTAQNPDVYFQGREAANPYYLRTPGIVQQTMDQFAALTGRVYHLFDYVGAPNAERVIVLMGSGAETVEETVRYLLERGERVGLLKVRLYRPFHVEAFVRALPPTTTRIAVLDRTKEPGSTGEPLYQDVVTAVCEGVATGIAPFHAIPRVIGGRYGLSSKEFTPAMVLAVFEELRRPEPRNHFTVGIHDDVTHTSLDYDPDFCLEPEDTVRAVFWGLGSDGTVGANKNSIKIIGEGTDYYAQGYFVYDSKKSGSMTISHLRFGPRPIQSAYLIQKASFVAVHHFDFLARYPVLDAAAPGATVLLNSPFPPGEVWQHLPPAVQQQIVQKHLKLYVIDGYGVAKATGMGRRINTVMQTAFFALSGVLPRDRAIARIKEAIRRTYGKRGEAVVQRNCAAVDRALEGLFPVDVPTDAVVDVPAAPTPVVPEDAPEFVRKVTAEMIAGRGDHLPVSALPADGTFPTGTAQWEKRNIALEVPVWEPDLCIQCGKCVLVCPHATIRAKVYPESLLAAAPPAFRSAAAKFRELPGQRYTVQVAVEDCTGCTLCVEVCPARDRSNVGRKALNMAPQRPLRAQEARNWDFFLRIPDVPRDGTLRFNTIKNVQLLQPLFEFSGACSGCGETPYLRLLSQLFGDRALIANATGCSSIYGGNLPTTPWTRNREGRGPAWSNSLFEDNAEFGLGMRLTLDQQTRYVHRLLEEFRELIGAALVDALLAHANATTDGAIRAQRERIALLRERLEGLPQPRARDLHLLADLLVRRSVWIVGGDGWAYDIGYGGLDHVLASGYNVNVLVLDTEVYSNTGGQASKSTARGAVAKFASGGKTRPKKDLGRLIMGYGNVYVAQVAMGANDQQTLRAFMEAEAYEGPSLIIAYSHCIAHGIDMAKGLQQQKLAVETGYWPLYRYHPDLARAGENPFQLDSKPPSLPLQDYLYTEGRFRMLQQSDPEAAARLLKLAQADVWERWNIYQKMAATGIAAGA
ncbi:MAG: pyruvate:ferredoxin (flavodoxin) oxidoreductase [Chloroherpetonaceae bacterium]|nr:pyruvate:ferredoxin (flavodoxin) oxidoreductase [Chthonomonadaceae bacterium]MDW8208854.1 pyruvate:ferredoxin (flavodoxin) oxidoreductase [Chloroherpetonaceae bacterium]